uniref:Uncharacterized protein n=1 Tax=Meloidogyne enterolobii TaxID=390850 RepID=A0A6V7WYL2_MELEN|nr:unnamed protein product [Meloidogyne enterolobii]
MLFCQRGSVPSIGTEVVTSILRYIRLGFSADYRQRIVINPSCFFITSFVRKNSALMVNHSASNKHSELMLHLV